MKFKTLALSAVAIMAVAAVSVAQQAASTKEDPFAAVKEAVGKPVPKFEMKMLNDKVITNKDIKGKVVVFDFWATWCGPCKAAAPKLEEIYKEHGKNGFEIIGANLAERDANGQKTQAKDNAVKYVKEHGYTYAFTYANDEIGKDWKVPGYPTFFIVDRKGVVREVMVGFNEKRMRELVAQLVAEK